MASTRSCAEHQRWDRLFGILQGLSSELSKVDSGISAMREQLSLLQGRVEAIEEAMLMESESEGEGESEEDSEEMESSEDSDDRAFIDDTMTSSDSGSSE